MKAFSTVLFILLTFFGCKENNENDEEEKEISESIEPVDSLKEFKSENFQVNFYYPEGFEVKVDSLPAETPVINVFKAEDSTAAPFGIHEDPQTGYMAILPKGFGVDGPAGERASLEEFGNPLPLDFEIDPKESRVYLLENGEPWGYHLTFHTPPQTWGAYGNIFIRYPVNNFETECFSANADQKKMEECDPLGGDKISYYGSVDQNFREELNQVLKDLYFYRENTPRQNISELIKVERPEEGSRLVSPLAISGRARGNWFFEADAPVKLLDGKYRTISESYIKVNGTNWMTEDFVPFKGKLEFKEPKTEKGYLVLKKANASGKPEMDRIIRIPVQF